MSQAKCFLMFFFSHIVLDLYLLVANTGDWLYCLVLPVIHLHMCSDLHNIVLISSFLSKQYVSHQ